ncbi:alpha/beta fold hydrolase [Mycobacterium sp. 141]|uniref:alpha/beta fold hydrolase n=1 Tax=Mycobacterium sp. 141 TaxID=1120797 RepID=UPI0018CB8685|nr:alpha/beta hydrolase [Mycobacterium sp. 141]
MIVDSEMALASDGTRLFVSEHGQGDDVLFIPGLGYAGWCWERQVGPISEFARMLAMDNRGVGHSDKPRNRYSIEQMADDAYEVLRQKARGPAHVVGTSMGGYIAQSLALRHPDVVRSLILVSTTSGGEGCTPVPDETLRCWIGASGLSPAEFARATMPMSFTPGWARQHPEEFEELLALRLHASTPTATWRLQFEASAVFLHDGLPQGDINRPITIVHGTADRVVPYANVAHLERRHPHASVITLDGAGHLCWIERPDVFNDIVRTAVSATGNEDLGNTFR